MPGMLFVHGGEAAARAASARGTVDWSRGLPVVLEKYGYLDLDIAGPEVLADASTYRRYGVVLVGRLGPEEDTYAFLQMAKVGDAEVLLDGPATPDVARFVGATPAAPVAEPGIMPTPVLRRSAAVFGLPIGGVLRDSYSHPVELRSAYLWPNVPDIPLDAPRAAAWQSPARDIVPWEEADGEVLAEWVHHPTPPRRGPAIVRTRRITACAFDLFGFLAAHHSSPPFAGAEYRSSDRIAGIEALLLGLIDDAHRRAGVLRGRLLPWPGRARWAVTLRCEVDAPVRARDAAAIAEAASDAGLAATWTVPGKAATRRTLRGVARQPRTEVALSAELLWVGGHRERGYVERLAGVPVSGGIVRGAADGFRYQGAPSVLWFRKADLAYTELLDRAHFHPHRFSEPTAQGAITIGSPLCLPRAESVRSGAVDEARVASMLRQWRAAQGHLQVAVATERPDSARKLARLLAKLPDDALRWTAAEVAEWWAASHSLDRVSLRVDSRGSIIASSEVPLPQAQLEVLRPAGSRALIRSDISAEPRALNVA